VGSPRIRNLALEDLEEANRLFSVSFTDAYRRDGLPGMSVPLLHPDFLKLEWQVSGDGAFCLEEQDRLLGFVLARAHGSEGWFGPLAVEPGYQGRGLGKVLVAKAVTYLKRKGCTTIGLETMPRTYRNLGLYTKAGFQPGHLVLTMKVDVARASIPAGSSPGRSGLATEAIPEERERLREGLRRFWGEISPGLDYEPEIRATLERDYGDVLYLRENERIAGFVFFHHAPYFVSDGYGVLRVARLGAVRGTGAFGKILHELAAHGVREGMDEVYLRCETSDWEVTRALFEWGFRVVHSDLRMCLEGYPKRSAADRIHLSRWG